MKDFLRLLLCLLCLSCVAKMSAQEAGDLRFRHIDADTMVIHLDSCSIDPQTFYIQNVNPTQYRLDPLTSTLYLRDSALLGTRLFMQYKTYSFDLSKPVAHRSLHDVEPGRRGHEIVEIPSTPLTDLLNDQSLYTNGSISRGVSVGNNQDLVLNSSLNLQISGKLSEDVEIMASVTDKNIPIQPEGNTQTLQDISSIFITVKIKEMALFNAGDVVWRCDSDNFLKVSRNMLGLNAMVRSKPKENVKMFNQAGGGMAKGKFTRQTVTIQNGVQGPYKLYGADGEVSILMVAGSERVYVDGQLLTRGAEKDYVVDYNTAEITFTPKMLMTAEKRVIVEFEYSNRHYSRYNLFTQNEIEVDGKIPFKLRLNLFHEQDLKNHSIQPELTVDHKRFLAELGDAGAVAYYPVADSMAYTPDRILYEKVDTIYKNKIYTIYKYSTNNTAQLYSPSFTYMGTKKGNYQLVSSTANGRVFAWVAPDGEIPQGDYEPVLLLTAPTSQQMATLGIDLACRENTMITSELAVSHYDINTFSKQDRQNDVGLAYLLKVNDVEKFASKKDTLPWLLTSHAQLQYVHQNFTPFESFREVEFARDYNLASDYAQNRAEWWLQAGLALSKLKYHQYLYDFNWLNRVGEVNALRNELQTDDYWQTWHLKTRNSFLLTRDSIQKSRYWVSRTQLAKQWKWLTADIDNLLEYNVFNDSESGMLRLNSYAFNELNAALKSQEKAKHQWLLGYKNRVEWTPDSLQMRPHLLVHEFKTQYQFAQIKNQSFLLNATYRRQSFFDSLQKGHAENYFVGNLQYTGRFLRNALIINTYYDVGSGMELKKTYTYIKVAKGQGTHVWNDYNGNGIQELDEFEVAQFVDQAEYVKVWIAGTDYVNVYQNQWTQSVQLRPAAVWANKKGFRKFLSRFSNVLSINTFLKHKTRMFIPFSFSETDSNLVANRTNITNTFSFNNSSSKFAFDFIVQDASNTQFLYYGLETNKVKYQEVILKSTPIPPLYLQTSFLHNNTLNHSTYFSSRCYQVESYSTDLLIRLQLWNRLTASLTGQYAHRVNRQGVEHVDRYRADFLADYRILEKGTFSLSAEYVYLNGDVGQNSSVSYFLTEGLSMGQNLLWTAACQFSVTQFLQLSVQYQGRAMQGHAVIHTGNVTVSALF